MRNHFPVRVDKNNTIGVPKDVIKARHAPDMDNIASRHLKLWKWNQPIGAERVKDLNLTG